MAIDRFSIHGISAIVQSPEVIIQENRQTNPGFPRWKGKKGGATWFHFAVPTPHKVRGKQIDELFQIFLKVRRDEGVEVQTIHIRIGDSLRRDYPNPAIPPNELYQYECGSYNHQLNIRNTGDPLCISVLVKWVEEGYIRFTEAGGAWLDD